MLRGFERQEVSYFQDARGQLLLSPVDTDARWRTTRSGTPSGLNYQESIIVDLGRFHPLQGSYSRLRRGMESSAGTAGEAAL